jgi:hypothetical protein
VAERVDLVDDLQAAHVRHVQIEQDEIRLEALEHRRRLAWVVGAVETREPGALEQALQQVHVRRLVVDDQDAGFLETLHLPEFPQRLFMARLNQH